MDKDLFKKGFTQIPNDLLDNMMKIKLGGSSLRILIAIVRKTFGFKHFKDKWRFDFISYSQLTALFSMSQNIWREALSTTSTFGCLPRTPK